MVQSAKTQRIVLKIEEQSDGNFVMKKCSDKWTTLPFVWPSKASALADLQLVVDGLVKAGYEVIPPTEGATPKL